MLKKVSSSFLAYTPCVKRMYSEGCQARQILEPNWFLPYVCVERCSVISGYKWHLPAYWICWCVSLNLLLRVATIAYALTSSPFTVHNTLCSWSRSMDVDGMLRANMAEASSIEDKFHSPNRGWSKSGHNIGPPPKPNLSCTLFQPCPGGWNSHTLHQPTTRAQCWYRPSAPADRFQWSVGRCRCGKKPSTRILLLLTLIVRHSSVFKMAWWTHRDPEAVSSKMTWRLKKWQRPCKWACDKNILQITTEIWLNVQFTQWNLISCWDVVNPCRVFNIRLRHVWIQYVWTTIASGNCVWSWKSCSTSWSRSAWIHIWSKTYRSWIHALSVVHTKKARWQGHFAFGSSHHRLCTPIQPGWLK